MKTSTIPPPPPPVNPSLHPTTIPQQQTPDSTTTTTYPTTTLPEIPNFMSLFQFNQRVSALETKVFEFNQTSKFAEAASSIPSIVDNYLALKLKEEVNVAVRLQSNKLKEEAEAENQEFINQVDSIMKQIIKEQVKAQTSYAVAASLSEFKLKKILIGKMETNKLINKSDIQNNLYNALIEAYNSDKDIFTSYGDYNLEGREYPFDLSKPLPSIEDQGRQVFPPDYLINNDLEYLKGGSSSSKYATSTTRTKAAKIIAVTSVKVMRWYDYGYLEEIVVRRDDNVLYKFKEGDFPRLNLRDIEDMLLFLVQKKLSNLDVDDRYDLGV
nr:hypothetical protein [Tanacetum cinerariifolium]